MSKIKDDISQETRTLLFGYNVGTDYIQVVSDNFANTICNLIANNLPKMSEKEIDNCFPGKRQLEQYLSEPDDVVAASLTPKDKRLVAKVILFGSNLLKAYQDKLKAWMEGI